MTDPTADHPEPALSEPDHSEPDHSVPDQPAGDTRRLDDLSRRLTQALQILDLEVDYPLLLGLASQATRAAGPDAGPISTFLVGYAAGTASTSGKQAARAAVDRAARVAAQATEKTGDGDVHDGWAHTAQ